MGRVNRLLERRVLRRAADQALLASMSQRPDSAAGQPGGAPDQDFEYTRSDAADTRASYDHEPTTEPIPVADVHEVAPDQSDDYAWAGDDDVDDAPADAVGVAAPEVEPDDLPHDYYPWVDDDQVPAEPADVYDLVPGQLGGPERDDAGEAPPPAPAPVRPLRARPLADAAPAPPALDFAMPESRPWYRTTLASALLVAAVIAAVVCGGWLVVRSPSTTAEESTIEAPTSAPPVPSKAQPTAMSAPQPPPLPPPPPPPAEEPVYSAPQRQYSEPRYSAPQPAEKPRVDVTRAPISVAPVPKPVPGSSDSDTPGQQPRRRGCFGFC